MKKVLAITTVLIFATVFGCTGMSNTEQSTLSGGAIGAAAGAGIAAIAGGNAGVGAAVGAGAGLLGGYLSGKSKEGK